MRIKMTINENYDKEQELVDELILQSLIEDGYVLSEEDNWLTPNKITCSKGKEKK